MIRILHDQDSYCLLLWKNLSEVHFDICSRCLKQTQFSEKSDRIQVKEVLSMLKNTESLMQGHKNWNGLTLHKWAYLEC